MRLKRIEDTLAVAETGLFGAAQRFDPRPRTGGDIRQTGYDEPLLHTMYVDKTLPGAKAVQTLSRLDRAHPQQHDPFVLDFMIDFDATKTSFEPHHRITAPQSSTRNLPPTRCAT